MLAVVRLDGQWVLPIVVVGLGCCLVDMHRVCVDDCRVRVRRCVGVRGCRSIVAVVVSVCIVVVASAQREVGCTRAFV